MDSADSQDSVQSAPPSNVPKPATSVRSRRSRWRLGLAIAAAGLAIAVSQFRPIALLGPFENLVFALEMQYQGWFDGQSATHPLALLAIAFVGGLIASLSPCILAMLPINLSYIGTRTVRSRWQAARNAIAFVLGVITISSLFGLFSSLAGFVTIQYQGVVYVAVGLLISLMGLNMLDVIRLRLPQTAVSLPIPGAYGVGVTFALVSSPCTSPVMFSVLAAAGATGSQVQGVLTMVSYAIGYTAVIFFASLFAGFVKQTRWLLHHSETLMRVGGAVLMLAGMYYLVSGVRWIWAIALAG